MSEYQEPYKTKDYSGALFRNDKKETDKHPDYRGSAVIDGVEMWVSSWINTSAKGTKYMSLSFQRKDEVHNQGMQQAQAAAAPDNFPDEDVPF
jgi:uncharacterized protein (DUF736 family)